MARRLSYAVVLVVVVLLSLPLAGVAAPGPQASGGTYVVKRGDSLGDIAWNLGVSSSALARANGIRNYNLLYPGQMLVIPGKSTANTVGSNSAAAVTSQPAAQDDSGSKAATQYHQESQPAVQDYAEEESQPAHGGKWIDVDLAEQTLSAYVGDSLIFHTLVSTGTEDYPTPTGTFEILDHSPSNDMTGPGYYLADVPNVMVFKWRNYAIHGTYWHDNFGQPMSHGCINMTIADSAWLYKWAPDGTPVIIHW